MKYLLFITDKNINIDRFFTARIETKLEMQLRKFKLLHFFNAYKEYPFSMLYMPKKNSGKGLLLFITYKCRIC